MRSLRSFLASASAPAPARKASAFQSAGSLSKPSRRSKLRIGRRPLLDPLEERRMMAVLPLTLADAAFQGSSAAGISSNPSFSADGQLVVFQSDAGNLTTNDFNGLSDIFVRNVSTGVTSLVSSAIGGLAGGGGSFNPLISADGRFVAFESEANNLVSGDNNGAIRDVFVRDLQTGTTALISVNQSGGNTNNHSGVDFISNDGELVGFHSNATNIVSLPTSNIQNLFVRNRVAGVTSLVSVSFDNTQAGNGPTPGANRARISPDGRFVAFESSATNLVSNDINGVFPDVFIRDLELGTTTLVSINRDGTGSGSSQSIAPMFDPTGRYIAFASKATNLVAGTVLSDQVYLRDLLLGTTELVSTGNNFDGEVPRQTLTPSFAFSPDGRYLAYEGTITDTLSQVYARDLVNDVTLLISSNTTGPHLADRQSFGPQFTADSQRVCFSSTATNLVAGVTAGLSQIYVRNLTNSTTSLVSRNPDLSPGNAASSRPVISPDGTSLLFQSSATGLALNDNNALQDLFRVDVAFGLVTLFSQRSPQMPAAYTSRTTSATPRVPTGMSTDGRYVVYTSDARDLVTTPTFGRNVYRADLLLGINELISINADGLSGGQAGIDVLGKPATSADGRYVVFDSSVAALVPGLQFANIAGVRGIFVRDTIAGTTRVVNLNQLGRVAGNSGDRYAISPNGRYVAFATVQSLLAADTNTSSDVYVYDLQSNTLSLASSNPSGTSGNNFSTIFTQGAVGAAQNIFSDDGRYLLFSSRATDLVAVGGASDALYRRDLQTGTTVLVSVAADGSARPAQGESISADGQRVAFVTQSQLLPSDGNAQFDVYLRDLNAGPMTLVSAGQQFGGFAPLVSRDGAKVLYTASGLSVRLLQYDITSQQTITIHTGNDSDYFAAMSNDGRFVAFLNADALLTPNDSNAASDAFLYDTQAQTTRLLSSNLANNGASNRGVQQSQLFISGSGARVAFASASTNMIAGDVNGAVDIFAYSQASGQGVLSGRLYVDADDSGTFNTGDTPLEGWFVSIDNGDGIFQPGELQAFTDANGNYAFTGLPDGGYRLVAEQRSGFQVTDPPDGFWEAAIVSGDTVGLLDFLFEFDAPDLVPTTVFAPSNVLPGRQYFITWHVANLGSEDALGSWQDALYLSQDNQLDAADILLTTSTHDGGLLAGGDYLNLLTATIPAVAPGTYFVIGVTDRRHQTSQVVTSNDVRVSDPVTVDPPPALAFDTPRADVFNGSNQRHYYQVTATDNDSLQLLLDSTAADGALAIYVSYGKLPTPGDFDFRSDELSPDHRLIVPRTVAGGTYYVLVESRLGNAAAAPYFITASLPGLTINGVSPNTGGNIGQVTVQIDGSNFTPGALVEISQGLTTITATAVTFQDASRLYATFDLTGVAIGDYDVRVNTGSDLEVSVGAFHVVQGVRVPLSYNLVTPVYIRHGRQSAVVLEVTNNSSVDVVAPLLGLRTDEAFLRLAEQIGLGSDSIPFLAISADGPAGILRAGQTTRVEFSFTSFSFEGEQIPVNLEVPDDLNQTIDWAALKSANRPMFVSDEAWDVIFNQLIAMVGTTAAGYQQLLADSATYLSQLGERTNDVTRLLSLALRQANNAQLPLDASVVTDLAIDSTGISLDLTRTAASSISGRYRLGAFGRDWSHQWEVTAATDDLDNVTIEYGSQTRMFIKQQNGGFLGLEGDVGQLTVIGGAYRLREASGLVQQFRTDGKLDYIEDANGNRVTAQYNAQLQLSSLTHSNGVSLTLVYNAQGRLSDVTASNGETVHYTYDVSGEHLLSATSAAGTTQYTYVTGQGAAREHALASITASSGLQDLYDYDDRGRLIEQTLQGGTQFVTLEYGPYGQVRITDNSGLENTYWFNEFGQQERMLDTYGNSLSYSYDANHRLSSFTDAQGATSYFTFCACGSLLNLIDADGNEIRADYDPLFRTMTSIVDARGIKTTFEVDGQGNVTDSHYDDGSNEHFEYDDDGNVTDWTNRNGDALVYAYDDQGRLLTVTGPGISHTYTYDARGNLKTATDASGTTSMDYDAANRMTRVEYPNGRFIEYTYNAIGQPLTVNQNGFLLTYVYDPFGFLTDVLDASSNALAHYEYDDLGRLASELAGNGNRTTYEFNDQGKIASIVHRAPDNSVNSRFDYGYNSLGQRTSVTTLEGTTTYAYDLLGQLISVTLPTGRTVTYEYDAAGNRLRVIDDGVITNYAPDNLNRYASAGNATYTYDSNGNLKTKTDGSGTTTYTYNVFNQLIEVSGPGGTFQYEYNALGDRVAQIVNGVRREFLVDPAAAGDLVAEYDAQGNAVANYAYGLGLVGQFNSSGAFYFDFDAIGSTTGLTDASGNYVNRYSYLPFGETTVLQQAVETPFQFVGQFGVQNRGDGLLLMGVRNYDPTTGQFISEDPSRYEGGDANLRRYVGNNPVQFIDPTGFADLPELDADDLKKFMDPEGPKARQCTPNGNRWTFKTVPHQEMVNELYERGLRAMAAADEQAAAYASKMAQKKMLKIQLPPVPPEASALSKLGGMAGAACPAVDAVGGWFLAGEVFHVMLVEIELSNISILLGAWDPNDIVGPSGPDDTQHFITPDPTFAYTIHFENDPDLATAPAQEVFVTLQLNQNLDWSTFELGDVGFGSMVVDVPSGQQSYHTQVNYQNQDGSPLLVDVDAAFDLSTGTVVWAFRSVDPIGGGLPAGVFDGFLPVNDSTARGEGFINYLVHPKTTLVTGDTATAQASIVFDLNAPILTNVFVNTIDVGAPASEVTALPASVTSTSFQVSWSGTDDGNGPSGAGIDAFDIFVSDNGGAFQVWLTQTKLTSASYVGVAGHTYAFYSVATDLLGHVEAAPVSADTATLVDVDTSVITISGGVATVHGRDEDDVVIVRGGGALLEVEFNGVIHTIDPAQINTLRLELGGGNDLARLITLDTMPATVVIEGGEGNDTTEIVLNGSRALDPLGSQQRLVIVSGGTGEDHLLVDDSARTTDQVAFIYATLLTGWGFYGNVLYNASSTDVESVDLKLGSGNDLVGVSGLSAATTIHGGTGNEILTVEPQFSDPLIYQADGGYDWLNLITLGETDNKVFVTSSTVESGAATIEYHDLDVLDLNTYGGNDLITINHENSIAELPGIIRIFGGTSAPGRPELDRVLIRGTKESDVIGISDFFTALPGRYQLQGIEGVAILAWDGNDYVNNTSSVLTLVDGGAGTDYLLGGSAADFLFGGEDDDYLFGNDGNDILLPDHNTEFEPFARNDERISGGAGFDRYLNLGTDQIDTVELLLNNLTQLQQLLAGGLNDVTSLFDLLDDESGGA